MQLSPGRMSLDAVTATSLRGSVLRVAEAISDREIASAVLWPSASQDDCMV